jgi:hypothetical protein
MAVCRHHAAHQAVIEREGPEMPCYQDNRKTLALIGAESPRRQYLARFETQ